MNGKFLALGVLLNFITVSGVVQEKQQTPAPASTQTPPSEILSTGGRVSMSRAEMIGMKNDVNRMRVILHQMQNNMGAATSAQDPLKHQVELEIEMWQVVIDQMDRRIKAAGGE